MDKQIEFGVWAKDEITGFTGVVTGRCEYITGCNQVLLAGRATDGKPGESRWFDVPRVTVDTNMPQFVMPKEATAAAPGPDTPAPIK